MLSPLTVVYVAPANCLLSALAALGEFILRLLFRDGSSKIYEQRITFYHSSLCFNNVPRQDCLLLKHRTIWTNQSLIVVMQDSRLPTKGTSS